MKHIIAIDFGSSKIAVAAAVPSDSGLRVVAYEQEPVAIGIKNGEINNNSKVKQTLMAVIKRVEDIIGEKIDEACVNVSGKFLNCTPSTYSKIRSKADSEITEKELRECYITQFKRKFDDISLSVFDVIEQSFNVDDNIGFPKDAVIGMSGKMLEIKYAVVSGKESIIERIRKVLDDCNVRISKSIISPIASSRAVLTKDEMENGTVLVDIGKGVTSISIVRDNVVRYVASIPFAGESVTNDIKQVTGLSYVWSERVKMEYGCCIEEATSENKKLILHSEKGVKENEVDLTLLTRIVEARMSEILDAVNYLIEQSGYASKIAKGVVFTGGTCYLTYLTDLAKAILDRPCRIAAPLDNISPDSVEGSFDTYASTAIGLLLESASPILSISETIKPANQTEQKKDDDIHIDNGNDKESDSTKGEQKNTRNWLSGIFGKKSKTEITEKETPKEIEEKPTVADSVSEVSSKDSEPAEQPKKTEKKIPDTKGKKKKPKVEEEEGWTLFKEIKDMINDSNNEA